MERVGAEPGLDALRAGYEEAQTRFRATGDTSCWSAGVDPRQYVGIDGGNRRFHRCVRREDSGRGHKEGKLGKQEFDIVNQVPHDAAGDRACHQRLGEGRAGLLRARSDSAAP